MRNALYGLSLFISLIPKPGFSQGAESGPPPEKTMHGKVNFDYTLRFDPKLNGLPPPLIELDYEVTEKKIRIGQSSISDETLKIFIGHPNSMDPNIKYFNKLSKEELLIISVPKPLFDDGKIEIISEGGSVQWDYTFSSSDKKLGKKLYSLLNNSYFNTKERLAVFATPIPTKNIPVLSGEIKGNFRLCLKHKEQNDLFTVICSPFYRVSQSTKQIKQVSRPAPTRVLINNKESPLATNFNLNDENSVVHFLASNSSQYLVEFKGRPKELSLVDFFKDENGVVTLVGHSNIPTNSSVVVLNPVDETSLAYKFGSTIGEEQKYWSTKASPESVLFVCGYGGGEFTYKLKLDHVPDKSKIISIESDTLSATYRNALPIYGSIPPDSRFSAQQKQIKTLRHKIGKFVWNFELSGPSEEQTRSIRLEDHQNNVWVANYSAFRGMANELSVRLGGVALSAKQFNVLSELSYSHWFEDVFGWQNRLFSVQRWGVSFKEFHPIKSFEANDSSDSNITIAMRKLDLKYRLTAGVWQRDETWGLILGYQDTKVNSVHASLLGAGFFWARSMPRVFDDLFNYLPYMKYPKWVDLDLMYYPSSLLRNIKPVQNYSINFHGKVMWTKTIFGELGFGYQSINSISLDDQLRSKFQSVYSTVGLGISF